MFDKGHRKIYYILSELKTGYFPNFLIVANIEILAEPVSNFVARFPFIWLALERIYSFKRIILRGIATFPASPSTCGNIKPAYVRLAPRVSDLPQSQLLQLPEMTHLIVGAPSGSSNLKARIIAMRNE